MHMSRFNFDKHFFLFNTCSISLCLKTIALYTQGHSKRNTYYMLDTFRMRGRIALKSAIRIIQHMIHTL